MRVAWVCYQPPMEPYGGETLKSYSALNALVGPTTSGVDGIDHANHPSELELHLISFYDSRALDSRVVQSTLRTTYPRLSSIALLALGPKPSLGLGLFRKRLLTSLQVDQPALHQQLKSLQPDLIVFDYLMFAPLAGRYGARCILSVNDCNSEMYRLHAYHSRRWRPSWWRLKLQQWLSAYYERHFLPLAGHVHVVAQRDDELLAANLTKGQCHVIPNGWGHPLVPWQEAISCELMLWGRLDNPSVLVGVFAFLPAWFAQSNITPWVVGGVSESKAKLLLGRYFSKVCYQPRLERQGGVAVRSKVVVVPDHHTPGFKNRAMEALLSGQVLACLQDQLGGLEFLDQRHGLFAESMPALAKQVGQFLESKDYGGLPESARARV